MVERSLSMREVLGSIPGASKTLLFDPFTETGSHCYTAMTCELNQIEGGVAQMVERSLSMREVPGSMPGASNYF